jgi:hypothetical protein
VRNPTFDKVGNLNPVNFLGEFSEDLKWWAISFEGCKIVSELLYHRSLTTNLKVHVREMNRSISKKTAVIQSG